MGIQFQDNLQWKCQISGKGGILAALNSRLFIIRWLKNHLSMDSIRKIVDGIFTSKIRYGLQLLGRVRSTSSDPQCADLKSIQLVQNQMMRCLNGTTIKDKISTSSLLQKYNLLSVNQMNAIRGKPMEVGNTNVTQNTSTSDAIRIWNKSPSSVTGAKSLTLVKKAIKEFVKCLPI